jgi:hypothetical protein
VDIKNAFPSTDHNLLTGLLGRLSGLGECPQLLASYLHDREMFVDNCGTHSACAVASRGVPQGSIIAPLLFSLYYSDVVTCFAAEDVLLYADDTAVISSSPDLAATLASLSANAQILERYLADKAMRLNVTKTLYMLFCVPDVLCRAGLQVSTGLIRSTQEFKYLGIWFDTSLSFESHCSHIVSKVKSRLYMLLRYPRKRNWRERRVVFFAFLYPVFLYGIECYMHCNSSARQKLERLYRKCARLVLGLSVSHDDMSVYAKLCLLPLRHLFQLQGASMVYSTVRLEAYPLFRGYFHFQRANGRHSLDLVYPQVMSERSRKSFRYWGAKLWNSIPSYVRQATTLKQFKQLYTSYLRIHAASHSDAYDLYVFV